MKHTYTPVEGKMAPDSGAAKLNGLQPLPAKLMGEFEQASVERVVLSALRYDERYQGPIRAAKVAMIAARFSPVLAGVLVVSRRGDGSLYDVDGLHRSSAAISKGIKTLPAYVFVGLSLQEEAAIYDVLNTARKMPSALAVFRSRLLQGLPLHVSVNRTVEKAGLRIALDGEKTIGTIRAVASLLTAYRRIGEGLSDALSILHTAWPNDADALDGSLIRGLSKLMATYPGRLAPSEVVLSFSRVTPREILRNAHAGAGGGARMSRDMATATELLCVFNKGRRSNRLDAGRLLTDRGAPGEEASS